MQCCRAESRIVAQEFLHSVSWKRRSVEVRGRHITRDVTQLTSATKSYVARRAARPVVDKRPYVSPTSYLPNLVGRGNQLPNFACGSAPALFSINRRHLREDESAKDTEIDRYMSRLRVIQHFMRTHLGACGIGRRYLLNVETTCCSGLSATCEA